MPQLRLFSSQISQHMTTSKYTIFGQKGNTFSRTIKIFLIFLLIGLGGLKQAEGQNCSVNAGIAQTICVNQPLYLQGSISGLLKDGIATWTQIAGPAATIVSPNVLNTQVTNLIGGNSYTFRITTTCADGSLTYQDVNHTVSPISIASAGPDATYCPGINVGTLSANAPGSGETGVWSGSGANGVIVNNPSSPTSAITLSGGSSGAATLRWTITNPNGCTSYDDVVITNRGGLITVTAGANQLLDHCFSSTQSTNLAGSYAGSGISGQTGTWSIVSGPNVPLIVSPNSSNTSVTGLIEGVYVFRWTVVGPCASGTAQVQITVPAATADVSKASIPSGNQIFCDPVITSTVLNGSIPQYINETVQWVQTSGPAATIVSPNSPVTTITGLTSGNSYTFSYTINNAVTACSSTSSVNISYDPNPPSLSITTPDPILLVCNAGSASINFIDGGSGTTQYRILSGPVTAGLTFPTGWTNTSASPVTINGLLSSGTYLVQMRRITTTGGNCSTPFSEISIVTSYDAVAANAGTDQILNCNIAGTDLVGNDPTLNGGKGIGTWSQVSGPSAILLTSPHSFNLTIGGLLPDGLYVFRWMISGGPNCPTTQDDVNVYTAKVTPTTYDAGPNQTGICYNTPVYLNAATPAYVFERGTWSVTPSAGINFSDIHNPKAIVTGLLPYTTYTFTWSLSNNCGTATDFMTVDVIDVLGPIVSNAGVDQCVSSGTTSITLAGNDPSPGTGVWTKIAGPASGTITNNALYNSTVTGLSNGTYKFEWAISSGGCNPTRDTVTVTIDTPVTTSAAGADLKICGTSGTLNPSGSAPTTGTGKWTQVSGNAGLLFDGNADPSTWTQVSPVISNLQSGVYVFRYTITNGACTSFDDVSVFVSDPAPSLALAGTSPKTICGFSSVIMDATAPVSGTGRWTIVSGPNTPTIVTPSSSSSNITGLITGTYIFKWTVSGGIYCTPSSSTVTVDVTLPADAGSDQSYCETITSVNLTGTLASTGTWTMFSGPSAATITKTSENTAIASALISGVYTFRYTIAGGCGSTDDMTVTLYSPPSIANAGSDQILCNAASFTMSATNPVSGTGTWSKLSGPAGGSFSNINAFNATFNGATPGDYVFLWTVANSTCSNADQVKITNFAAPSAAVAGADQNLTCATTTTMAATSPAIGLGTWTFVSQAGDGPTPTITNPLLFNSTITGMGPQSNGNPETYTFRWTVSNGTCTSNTQTVDITVYQTPTPANAGTDQSLCNQTSGTLDATPVTIGQGTWTQISPAVTTETFADLHLANTTVNNIIPGKTYVFRWTSSTVFCSSFDEVTVADLNLPTVADVSGTTTSYCSLVPIILVGNTPTDGTGTWTQISGSALTILSPNSPTTSAIGGTMGNTYGFSWTIGNACDSNHDDVTVALNTIPSQALAGSDQVVCSPATSAVLNGNAPTLPATGSWSVVSGPNVPTFSLISDRSATVSNLIPGTYVLRWSHVNGGCTTQDDMQITVYGATTPAAAGSDQLLCNSSSFSMAGNAAGSGETGTWIRISGPNNPTITATNSATTTITGTVPGTYVFRWRITSGTCPNTEDFVTITNAPAANAGPDQIGSAICGLTTVTLAGNNPSPGTGLWTITSGAGGTIAAPASTYNTTFSGVAGSTYTLTWTIANGVSCSTSDNIDITFNQTPTVNGISNQELCNGTSTAAITFTGTLPGTIYNWTNSAAGIGLPASGSGNISAFTATNGGTSPVVATITVTPSFTNTGGIVCTGTPTSFTITVNPTPTVSSASSLSICNNAIVAYTPTSAVASTTFPWTASLTSGTISGFNVSGSGPINDILVNSGTASGTVTYVITPTGPTPTFCVGAPLSLIVTVRPTPIVTAPLTNTICSNNSAGITLSTTVPGTTFYYATPTISGGAGNITGGAARVTPGNIDPISDVLVNTTATVQTATYTVFPIINGCIGSSITIVVTVNPTPKLTTGLVQSLCADAAGNATANLTMTTTPSMAGGVTYTWSAPTLTGGMTYTNNGSGTGIIIDNFNNPTALPQTATYSVTPTAPAGLGGCVGGPTTVVITINPKPIVTAGLVQTICSASNVNRSLTSTTAGATFSYPAPTISGVPGNITGGTARVAPGTIANITDLLVNTTGTDQTATYMVTATINGCAGDPVAVVITVNPKPIGVAQTKTICSGVAVNQALTTNPVLAGTTFTYPAPVGTGGITGGTARGTGSTADITDVLVNPTGTVQTATYTITPTNPSGGCVGSPFTITVTVNATPTGVTQTKTICSGFSVAQALTTIPVVAGATFTYPAPVVTGGITGGNARVTGSTANITDILINPTGTAQTAIYTITPTNPTGGCVGSTFTVTVTVNATPIGVAGTTTTCSGTALNHSLTTNPVVAGTTFTYLAPTVTGGITGGAARGTGSTAAITDVLVNPTAIVQTATYTITPRNPTGTCNGSTFTVIVTVNPRPKLTTGLVQSLCADAAGNATANLTMTTTPSMAGGVTYTWSAPTLTGGMTYTNNGSGTGIIIDNYNNPTALPQTATYSVTPTAPAGLGGCVGGPTTVVITINPKPIVTAGLVQTICSASNASRSLTSTTASATFSYPAPTISGVPGNITGGTARVAPGTIANITDLLVNTTGTDQTATYMVTATINGCAGDPVAVVITVNPKPIVTAGLVQANCSGTAASLVLTTTPDVPGTTFYWSAPTVTGGMTGGTARTSPGTSASITDILVNATSIPQTATYVVTPRSPSGCIGTTRNVVITVNPVPTVTSASSLSICSGLSTGNYIPTSAVAGTIFNWTAQNTIGTVTGYSLSGSGPINDVLANSGTGNGQVTYTIIPAGPAPTNCPGPTFQLKVDVLNCAPKIGVAKQLVSMTNNGDGTYEALFNIRVQNYGNIPLDNINVAENLTTTFGTVTNYAVLGLTSSSFDVNTSFAGVGNLLDNGGTRNILAVGASSDIRLRVKILSAGSYNNTVTASSTTPGTANDVSQNGSDPDPDGDVNPSNNSVVTPVVTACSPVMTLTANDGVMCHPNTLTYQTVATATNATSYLWTTDGTGTFSSTSALTPTYTPSASDVQDGQVQLTITAYSGGVCPNVTAKMILTIWTPPTVSVANATICAGNSYAITGATATNYSGLTWTSSGTGTFNNSSSLNPTYTPSAAEITAGTATLTLTATAKGTCTPVIASMVLTITKLPTVYAGTDATLCSSGGSYTISGATASNAASQLWTTNGTGTFTNGTTLTPTYTPSAADIATRQVQLTLTATGNGGCGTVSDFMVLNIWPAPTANAGPDASLCSGNNFVLTGATASNYASIAWTVTVGTGTFNNANSLNPTFTPTSTGTITLRLTAAKLDAACTTATDDISLTVTQSPTLTASSIVGTTCGATTGTVILTSSDASTITLNGTTQASGTTFTGLVAGYYTATSNGTCLATTGFRISNTTSTLSATIGSVTSPLCHNGTGSVVVNGTGGTGSLLYSLDGGSTQGTGSFAGVAVGSHTIKVTDGNGCAYTVSFDINNLSALNLSLASKTNVLCFGSSTASAIVVADGGTPTYTYSVDAGGPNVPTVTGNIITGMKVGTYTVRVTDVNLCTTTIPVVITQPVSTLDITTVAAVKVNPSCNGTATGSVNITVSGGTSPYSFAWTNGTNAQNATGLIAGTYSVTVTDASGCQITGGPYVLTNPAAVTLTASSIVGTTCGTATGTVILTSSDGSTITLNGTTQASASTFTGLVAGYYTATSNGACPVTTSFRISNTTSTLSATIGSVNSPLCHNGTGSVVVNGTGGTGSLLYSLDGGVTQGTGSFAGVAVGNHTIKVTDGNGCAYTVSFDINNPSALNLTLSSQVNVLCKGSSTGNATVIAAGGTPGYTYSVTAGPNVPSVTGNVITGMKAGAYTVHVVDANGCSQDLTVTITEPANILDVTNVAAVKVNPSCNGAATGSVNITVSGGTSPYSYAWTNGTNARNATGLIAGTYSVTVTDASGCQITGGPYVLADPTAVSLAASGIVNTNCNASVGAVTLTGSVTGTISLDGGAAQASPHTFTTLAAGYHSALFTAIAGGCTATTTFNIINTNSTLAATVSVADPLCYGDKVTATVTATGGAGSYTFLMNGIASNTTGIFTLLAAGKYNVLVTDANGCNYYLAFDINQPTPLVLSKTNQNDVTCQSLSDGSVILVGSGGTTGYSYSIISQPVGGAATILANVVSGMKAGAYTLRVTDANNCTADLPVTISASNCHPIASDDNITTPEDTPVFGNVLSNDTDPNGLSLTVTQFVIGGTSYGVGATATISGIGLLVVNSDGTFTFTPVANYNGSVPAATYTVTNGTNTNTAAIRITVTPVNDVPVAAIDAFTATEDVVLTGNLGSNDTPSGDGGNVWSVVTGPAHGSLVINPDGTFTYTPAANYNGPDSFTYKICDVDGSCTVATLVSLTIIPVNNAPVAVNDIDTTPEDVVKNGDVLTNDSDPDGNVITVTQFVINGDATVYPFGTTATITGVGTLVINSNGSYVFTPAANYNGPVPTVTYTISDGSLTATANLNITVTLVNDIPVAAIDAFTATEDVVLTGNLGSNDTPSGDGGNVWSVVTAPAHGTLIINVDGTFTYTPAANYNGPDSFTYKICDVDGSCTVATLVNLTVTPVNNSPVAVNDIATTPEDVVKSGNVLTNDSDPDGNVITVNQFMVNGDATVYPFGSTATITGVGTLVINSNGSFVFTPVANYNGPVPTVTYTISDGSLTATANLSITVTPVNDVPVAVADAFTGTEDVVLTGNLGSNDTPSGDGGNVWSVVTAPAHGTLIINVDGTFTYTPAANYNGPDSFTYKICDADGSCTTATLVSLTINPVNDAPVISDVQKTGIEDNNILFLPADFTSKFTDIDGNSLTQVQIITLPTNGILKLNSNPVSSGDVISAANIANLMFTPNTNWNGSTSFDWNGFDGTVYATIAAKVNMIITPVNDAPIAGADAMPSQLNPGGTNSIAVFADKFSGIDVDGTIASIRITTMPTNATSITINGITYSSIPAGGISIPSSATGQSLVTIAIDPVDGAVTSVMSYFVIDNEGLSSATSGSVTIPFTGLSISGTVFNDSNGLSDNTVNGNGSNSGGTLFINLVNTLNKVVASKAVALNGTYLFSEADGLAINTSYKLIITNGSKVAGTTLSTATYPVGVVSTGENIGNSVGNDGTVDGILTVDTNTGSLGNANFAILGAMSFSAGADAAICTSEGTYTLNGTAVNASSVLWTTSGTGSFNNPTLLNAVYTPSLDDITTGQVQLTLIATGVGGVNILSDMMVLTIWQAAKAFAGSDASTCSGSTFVLTGATASNYSLITWSSIGGTFSNANALNPTFTPTTTGSIMITLTATGLGICSNAVSSMTLSVTSTPIIKASSIVGTNCNAAVGSVVLTGSEEGLVTLDGISKTSPATFTNLAAGYYIAAFTPAAGGCTVTTSFNIVNINSTLLAKISTPEPLCYGGTVTALVTATGGTGSGTYTFVLDGVTTNTTGIFNNLGAGSYNVLVTDKNGCTYYLAFDIDQPTRLTLALSSKTDVLCNGSSTASIIVIASGGTTGYTYSILNEPIGATNAEVNANVVSNMEAGAYTIRVTDANGCIADLAINITQPLVATVSAGIDATICESDTYLISSSSFTNAATIIWTTSGTGYFNNTTTLHPVYSPSAADILNGSVTLTLKTSPAASCSVISDDMVLNISHLALVNAGADAAINEGSTFTVNTASTQYATSILWTHDGLGILTGANTLNPIYTPAAKETGVINLMLTSASASPCGSTNDKMVLTIKHVNHQPVAVADNFNALENQSLEGNLLPNDQDPDGDQLVLNTTPVQAPAHGKLVLLPNGDYTYQPVIDFQGTDTFTYQVCDNGTPSLCSIAKVTIVVGKDDKCEVFVPNSFSPNANGIHDTFKVRCLYNYENPIIEIYNRWGNLVFKKDHYGNVDYWGTESDAWWNGRSDNKLTIGDIDLPVGTYYYILKLNSSKVLTGFIYLNR